MAKANTIELTILGREYRVNCPVGAEDKLRAAAQHLHEKMAEIRNAGASSGKQLDADRIAVIAALNMAHQLQEFESSKQYDSSEMRHMHKLLDDAIALDRQMELD